MVPIVTKQLFVQIKKSEGTLGWRCI